MTRQPIYDLLRNLNIEITGEGEATISARIAETDFKIVFPDGAKIDDTLAIPHELTPYIESISEARRHLSFS